MNHSQLSNMSEQRTGYPMNPAQSATLLTLLETC